MQPFSLILAHLPHTPSPCFTQNTYRVLKFSDCQTFYLLLAWFLSSDLLQVKVKFSHTCQSLLSIGPGADTGVQAVSSQVTKPSTRQYAVITFYQVCGYIRSFRSPAHIQFQLTTLLSTQKGRQAELDWLTHVQRMVLPQQWSPISCRSSMGQGKFASKRAMFYHCYATNQYASLL